MPRVAWPAHPPLEGLQFRVPGAGVKLRGHRLDTLKKIWRAVYGAWMRLAFLLGTVNRYVLMTVFYWVIIDITNLILRVLRIDLLDRRLRPQTSYWHTKPPGTAATYKHQF